MGGPTIKRGESSGDIWTPWSFIRAVERNWGPLAVDLAATPQSAKAPLFISEVTNSLTVDWNLLWTPEYAATVLEKSPQLLNSSENAVRPTGADLHLGAGSVLGSTLNTKCAEDAPTLKNELKSLPQRRDIDNLKRVENGSGYDLRSTTHGDDSAEKNCLGIGTENFGNCVNNGGKTLVPTAGKLAESPKTTLSRLSIQPVREQSQLISSQPAQNATELKELDTRLSGVKSAFLTKSTYTSKSLMFLNPPYSNITPWVKKCAESYDLNEQVEIFLLIPASIGANWFWDWVWPYATVYSVGRMVFDNCFDKHGNLVTTPYPKDLMLAHYTNMTPSGVLQRWHWKLSLTNEEANLVVGAIPLQALPDAAPATSGE